LKKVKLSRIGALSQDLDFGLKFASKTAVKEEVTTTDRSK